jgi:hypothetical protein
VRQREPRPPALVPIDAALEPEIISTLDHWVELFQAMLNSEAGQRVMQDFFRQKLAANDDEAPAIIFHLARAGHRAAWLAAKAHARHVLNYEPNISAQVRSYLIDMMDLPEPGAPPSKDAVIDNLTRDIAIRILVEQGRARWPWLPQLNSSATQKSVAHYVAMILSRRGMPMGERQVRKICQQRATFAQRLADFLTASPN